MNFPTELKQCAIVKTFGLEPGNCATFIAIWSMYVSFSSENGIQWYFANNSFVCIAFEKDYILNFIRVVNKNVSIDYRNPLK